MQVNIMASRILACLLFAAVFATVDCNFEGDILYAWKTHLKDPNKILDSWDPKLDNPCPWFHVTCNLENLVTRVDLGNAGLSGPLIPQLGLLSNLQYLEVYSNNLNGTIPMKLGNLKNLVSLDLYDNQLSGSIPTSFSNLKSVRFMRVNSNLLTGTIPSGVLNLIKTGNLIILNVSDNLLTGTVHPRNSKGFAITTIVQDPNLFQSK